MTEDTGEIVYNGEEELVASANYPECDTESSEAHIINSGDSILSDTESLDEPAFAEIDLNKPVRRGWLSLGPADSEFYGVYKYEKNVHC